MGLFGMNPDERTIFDQEYRKAKKKEDKAYKEERRRIIKAKAEYKAKPLKEKIKSAYSVFEEKKKIAAKKLKKLDSKGFSFGGKLYNEPLISGGRSRKRKGGFY